MMHSQLGVVVLVHFLLLIYQSLMPNLRGSGVVVAGLAFIERELYETVSVECSWGLILKIAEPSAPYTHPVGGGAGGHTLRRPLLYLITRVWDVD